MGIKEFHNGAGSRLTASFPIREFRPKIKEVISTEECSEKGRVYSAFFRGFEEDISAVRNLLAVECGAKLINGNIFELIVKGGDLSSEDLIWEAMREYPRTKMYVFLWSKWEANEVASDSGYSYLTHYNHYYHDREQCDPDNDKSIQTSLEELHGAGIDYFGMRWTTLYRSEIP